MGSHVRHPTHSVGRVHVHRMVMPASRHRSAVVMPASTVRHRRCGKPLHGKCKGQQPDDEYAHQSGHAAQFSPRRFLYAARGSQGAADNWVIMMLPRWPMTRKLAASPTLAAASCFGETTRNTIVIPGMPSLFIGPCFRVILPCGRTARASSDKSLLHVVAPGAGRGL